MCSFAQTILISFSKNLLNDSIFVCTNTVGNTVLLFAQTVRQRCFRLHKHCQAIVFSLQKQVGNSVFVFTNTVRHQSFRLHKQPTVFSFAQSFGTLTAIAQTGNGVFVCTVLSLERCLTDTAQLGNKVLVITHPK